MNFDHLTTTEILSHIDRLTARLAQGSSIAYTLADMGLDHKELAALQAELRARNDEPDMGVTAKIRPSPCPYGQDGEAVCCGSPGVCQGPTRGRVALMESECV